MVCIFCLFCFVWPVGCVGVGVCVSWLVISVLGISVGAGCLDIHDDLVAVRLLIAIWFVRFGCGFW